MWPTYQLIQIQNKKLDEIKSKLQILQDEIESLKHPFYRSKRDENDDPRYNNYY